MYLLDSCSALGFSPASYDLVRPQPRLNLSRLPPDTQLNVIGLAPRELLVLQESEADQDQDSATNHKETMA
ncbi:unnamed protein product [Protopolystoma xenopodis]|uniref:UBX domain-containing protein n=1 Tax=Protopolystoma xenopodis TaxID=117903 RepID=A0A3S5C8U7_9PLAT|nr:unnamed protein product [Protopolystoma xenopodis]